MITRDQLHIYRTHWGDTELLYREGQPAEIETMQGDAWNRIEALIQDARTLEDGLTTPELATELRARIQAHTADEATRQLLQRLARAWPRIRPRLPLRLFQGVALGILMLVFAVGKGLAALLSSPIVRLLLGLLAWVALCALVRYLVESLWS